MAGICRRELQLRWTNATVVQSTFIIVLFALFGCTPATPPTASARGSKLLSGLEMDQISAGSAVTNANAKAVAVGLIPQTSTITNTLATSSNPISGQPFGSLLTSNYASSMVVAFAAAALFTQANGSTLVGVVGSGRGASITAMSAATASGSASGDAQINMQFYGLSIGKVDLVFGSATATSCCAPILGAQTAATPTGGVYRQQIQASPISDVPGQVQSRIDISVVSSALPILGSGQVSALTGPTLSSSLSQ